MVIMILHCKVEDNLKVILILHCGDEGGLVGLNGHYNTPL